MEENDDVLDLDQVNKEPVRPTFITVLCILTFVGAGLGLLTGLWGLFTMGQVQDSFDTLNRFGSEFTDYDDGWDNYWKWVKISSYLSLLGNALCLTGAFLMWNLKKAGYFIYVPGQIIPFFGAVMVVMSMSGLMDSSLATGGIFGMASSIGLVIGGLFPLAFIIMYGVNLKHMK